MAPSTQQKWLCDWKDHSTRAWRGGSRDRVSVPRKCRKKLLTAQWTRSLPATWWCHHLSDANCRTTQALRSFSGYKGDNWSESDGWHYIEAYQKFKDMFPRISTGNPRHPWRAGESLVHSQDNVKNSATKWQLWKTKTRKFDPTRETKI